MEHIINAARALCDEFGGRSVFDTAENSGIILWFRKLGNLKGFYMRENGQRYIIINRELDSMMRRTVCAHELGHDSLHRELSDAGIRDTTMFLDSNRTEREANIFAAELLISDGDILSELEYNTDIEAVCYALDVPPEIVRYKLEILNFKGYHFNADIVNSDFLKPAKHHED